MRSCKSTGKERTFKNYWNFCLKVKNLNYLFVQQMTLTISHALMLFHNGIHMNQLKSIYKGKNKLSLMLFGHNHPCHHRQLIAYEKKIEAVMPHEIQSIKLSSLVLSHKWRLGHYQSGHAIIKEIDKEAKRDLVGVPNEHHGENHFETWTT